MAGSEFTRQIMDEVRRLVRQEIETAIAGVMALGTAASAPYPDPDGSGRTVVDVTIGSSTWPAIVVRSGETIANGDMVIVLMFGQTQAAGWIVMKA